MKNETNTPTVDTQVIVRTIEEDSKRSMLTTISDRLTFLHPVAFLHDGLEFGPVHAIDRLRGEVV